MKISNVFWNAAQTENRYWGCCMAIGYGAKAKWEAQEFFADLFLPDAKEEDEFWWADPYETTEDQEARRLALLFAYYIAKDEEETNEN